MKHLKKFFLIIVGILLGPAVFAQTEYNNFNQTDATAGVSEFWTAMEGVLGNFTLFFGVFVVLAILVTGFFLGRKWLRRVG